MALSFDEMLKNYAELAVKIGLNIQPGQRLLMQAPIGAAQLVRPIAAAAYHSGARLVDVLWQDEQLDLIRFQSAPRDSFGEYSEWRAQARTAHAQRGDALLSITGNDPELLKGQDSEAIATMRKAEAQHTQPFRDLVARNAMPWLVISAPIASWAAKVFPREAPEDQLDRLWQAIFKACRLTENDPIAAWQKHIGQLAARSDYLNGKQYHALKYRGPGTDLTIGLPSRHIWKSAQDTTTSGIVFTPNLPTEEVFTMPHKDRIDGYVTSSKPLNYSGSLIDNFTLTFAAGRVVDLKASAGEDILRNLVATDQGASQLGEVALVPHSSPISQSGLLFFDTLFDENAASHLALGMAYKFTLEGGTAMSEEQFAQAGGNQSLIHIDFMIGSGQLDIDGITESGAAEPLMRSGEWAFEV